jgi:hypothetical protein
LPVGTQEDAVYKSEIVPKCQILNLPAP